MADQSSFEMSDEEVDPILQVPLAMTEMTFPDTMVTMPSYSIPPKVLYALDPRRRLEDDLHLKFIAKEKGRDSTAKMLVEKLLEFWLEISIH